MSMEKLGGRSFEPLARPEIELPNVTLCLDLLLLLVLCIRSLGSLVLESFAVPFSSFPRFTSNSRQIGGSRVSLETPINDATLLASQIEYRAPNCRTPPDSENNGHASLIRSRQLAAVSRQKAEINIEFLLRQTSSARQTKADTANRAQSAYDYEEWLHVSQKHGG